MVLWLLSSDDVPLPLQEKLGLVLHWSPWALCWNWVLMA